ncbi:substrate-binding domain-containing protein [Georgenia satyanarayanai]|uniref:substrate-binding domain-containing protein n=1 Tax=Georgenia satyanarayanai TaxID=860221 RepID=UPI00203DB333|nr:substrate-binding domain-containing protein [Georgenia satyanarayanai]MCM3662187.1 substrate-binding domain-containing protein [Georgenia satyanarayanai]
MRTSRTTTGRGSRRALALAATTLLLAGAACGSDNEPGGGATTSGDGDGGGGGDVSIGLITKTETNPFFVTMREVAAEYAGEQGVELTALAGAFDGDNEGQVQAMEDLIAQGVDGIMITPNNSTGVLGAIEQARAQGIIVIALDTATEPEDAVDATFATDNLEAGRLQGAYVRAAIGDAEPKLIMLDGTAGGTVDTFRHDGFLDGFGIEEGDAAILGMENTQGDQNNAQTAMENLLQRNPDVNAVYTINEPAARGAYAALEAQGLTDQVVIGSIDGGCQGVQDVADGQYAATVMQFPAEMVRQGMDAIIEAAGGGEAPSGFVDTGSVVITDNPVEGIDSETTEWGLENCWG